MVITIQSKAGLLLPGIFFPLSSRCVPPSVPARSIYNSVGLYHDISAGSAFPLARYWSSLLELPLALPSNIDKSKFKAFCGGQNKFGTAT